jgi:putative radical SAM enzyme (TIGR03279 family)
VTETAAGIVSGVQPGSLADEAGIEVGDAILSVGGHAPRDVVDYHFYEAESEVQVHIKKANGLEELLVFEKEIDEDLGLEFERATWDAVTLCNNNCFFCFLKGLPKGMRKSLYVKDDDYRLSFLHGNFVTLTNLEESDWERLEEQRLSPLHVSVHATELELRRTMLGNDRAPDVIADLKRLGELGIQVHTQIVLCPGVNDGAHLARSVRDLAEFYPTVQTISVVPVGASPKLEEWSLGHDRIELVAPNAAYARTIVEQVQAWQRDFRNRYGASVVQCADEYYVTAELPVPPATHYDGFPQYENGIGMVRTMLNDWSRTRRRLIAGRAGRSIRFQKVVLAGGTLIAPLLASIAGELNQIEGVSVRVRPIKNTVFGDRVNVSGLLCGKDYVEQLNDEAPECFILPRASLDYFGERFLDSMNREEVEAALGAPVAFASQWSEVVDILSKGPRPARRNPTSNGAFWSEPARPRRTGNR